jgi:hypothetical protein
MTDVTITVPIKEEEEHRHSESKAVEEESKQEALSLQQQDSSVKGSDDVKERKGSAELMPSDSAVQNPELKRTSRNKLIRADKQPATTSIVKKPPGPIPVLLGQNKLILKKKKDESTSDAKDGPKKARSVENSAQPAQESNIATQTLKKCGRNQLVLSKPPLEQEALKPSKSRVLYSECITIAHVSSSESWNFGRLQGLGDGRKPLLYKENHHTKPGCSARSRTFCTFQSCFVAHFFLSRDGDDTT